MSEKSLSINCLINEVKNATNSACRMLAIREHSHQQIRIKLTHKGYSDVSIENVIEYLVQENWISEARFCESFIRSKSAKGQGLMRILHELRKENIHELLIKQALIEEPVDWGLLCKKVLAKKIKSLSSNVNTKENENSKNIVKSAQSNLKNRIKLENFLNYRGFTHDEIRAAMKEHTIPVIKI
jgi:regulatory protein